MELPPKLFRFFGVPDRDTQTLEEGNVYYSSPPQLNDPFDCQLTLDTSMPEEEVIPTSLHMMQVAMQQTGTQLNMSLDEDIPFQQRFDYLCEDFLSCMFNYGIHALCAVPDHPLMWSHYAAGFHGFALVYDTSQPIDPGVLRSIFAVSYQTSPPSIALSDLLHSAEAFSTTKHLLLTTKGVTWSYEQEWRVIIWPGGRVERRPFEVSEVIFGHLLEEHHREKLRAIFGGAVRYTVAAPSESVFGVEFHNADAGRSRIQGKARPHRRRSTYFYNRRYGY